MVVAAQLLKNIWQPQAMATTLQVDYPPFEAHYEMPMLPVVLGTGSFAAVLLAKPKDKEKGTLVAVKVPIAHHDVVVKNNDNILLYEFNYY